MDKIIYIPGLYFIQSSNTTVLNTLTRFNVIKEPLYGNSNLDSNFIVDKIM